MPSPLDPALQALRQIPPARRVALGAVVMGVVVALLLVAQWASKPDYALLFGNLAASDAGRVVEQLESSGVTYDLRDGGASIYVPREEVYALRLRLATEGVVSEGPTGYELFDTGTLGMTDFMQKLNVKRALEGELSRTIGSIRQVRSARVHLVLPERSPFRDQQTPPSASVVLAVNGALGPDQTAGIAALVAGAVEGMSPSEVTVLDEAGRMLTGPELAGGTAGLTSAQLRMRQEVEDHLARAGQTMLDQMLGPGRAVVRVAAELDLSRTQSETNSVDPESQTVISEEKMEEAGAGAGSSSSVKNYEVTRQTVRAEQEAGGVKVLTVSVLLDEAAPAATAGRPVEEGEPVPFSDEQLRQIEALVKNAVGFDPERGDRFAVQQIRFSTDLTDAANAEAAASRRAEWVGLAVRYGIVLLALLLGYRLLRTLVGRIGEKKEDAAAPTPPIVITPEQVPSPPSFLPEASGDGAAHPLGDVAPRTVIESVEGDVYADKLSPEAHARLANAPDLLADVTAHVREDPLRAAELVRTWLREDAPA